MRTGFVALLWFISALFPFVYEDPQDLTTGTQDTIVRSSTTLTENGGTLTTPGG